MIACKSLKHISFIILWAILLYLSILSFNSKADAVDKKEKVILQLAWKHQFQFAGYYAAYVKGYYEEAGLDVIVMEGGEGRFAREEVLSGRAEYGVAGAELILHRIEKEPFVVLASIFQHSPSILLTRGDSKIEHPQDLIAKRVMLLPGNKDADILAVFQNEGIKLDLIKRMDQSYNLNDLINGHTDAVSAYMTNEPWYLEQAGIRPGIIKPSIYGVDFYSDCLFTTENEIENHPERVNSFLAASLRGWEYAMDNSEEIIDVILTRYGVKKTRDHLRFEADATRKLILPDLVQMGHMNPGRWRHIANTYLRLGMINPEYSLEGFIYNPYPEPELTWIRWILGIALLITLAIGIAALTLLFFNRQLKVEVDERRKAEALLKESESQKKAILHGIPANIAFVDKELKIIWVNRTATESVNKKPEEMIGRPCHEFWGNSSTPCKDCPTIKAFETKKSANAIIKTPDGRVWDERGEPVFDSQGNLMGVVEIAQDITEQKNIENQIRQAHKMESIGTLTGGIAHDFNNLLGVIIGNAELALDDVHEWSSAYLHLKTIRKASLKAADIVRQLLRVSKQTEQELIPTGIIKIVHDTLSLIKSTIPANIEIRKNMPARDKIILADPIQINQIIMNLCLNASHEMEQSGGILEISVDHINLNRKAVNGYPDLTPGDYVKLSISDTGSGIDEKLIDRVFDPYFTTKEFGKGSGMGLAVVHGIVKSHGGSISVDSKLGKGTKFSVLFPVFREKH